MLRHNKLILITYCLAGVQSLVASLGQANEDGNADDYVLDKYVQKYQQTRSQMEANVRQVAERFADEIGTGQMYQFDLNTFKGSYGETGSLTGLQEFKNKVRQLGKVSDADAAIQVLRQLNDNLRYEQLEDSAVVRQLLDSQLVPACDKFVDLMYTNVFGQQDLLAALKSTRLSAEVAMKGKTNEVKEFLMGWAQFHICKLLVHENTHLLVDRIVKRANDQKRISAKYGYKS